MPPRANLKRAAGSADPSTSQGAKRTRFVEPSEDSANFAEEVDSALENPSAHRRGRVRNEGYDSDSTDDGEGVVFSRKKGENENDEDDDMFALDETENKKQETSGKKKKEYMRLGDIEGQVFGDSGSENDSEENEPEDEDAAEARKKAGMGFELSSFNMRDEMEEGKFTDDGTYVRSFDPHAVHDRWMDGLDEKAIKQARRRKKQQEREQRAKIEAEERELQESGGKEALERELLGMMKKGETVLEALQRLGARAKKNNKSTKLKAESAIASNKPAKSPSDIEHITHLASNIMSLGDTDIYSKTYEELIRAVRSSGLVDPSWIPPSSNKKYEYKWDVPGAGQTDQTFGPFGEEEIMAWFNAFYFGPSGEKVKVREVGEEWAGWNDVFG